MHEYFDDPIPDPLPVAKRKFKKRYLVLGMVAGFLLGIATPDVNSSPKSPIIYPATYDSNLGLDHHGSKTRQYVQRSVVGRPVSP